MDLTMSATKKKKFSHVSLHQRKLSVNPGQSSVDLMVKPHAGLNSTRKLLNDQDSRNPKLMKESKGQQAKMESQQQLYKD